jgi:hypothetical protein
MQVIFVDLLKRVIYIVSADSVLQDITSWAYDQPLGYPTSGLFKDALATVCFIGI